MTSTVTGRDDARLSPIVDHLLDLESELIVCHGLLRAVLIIDETIEDRDHREGLIAVHNQMLDALERAKVAFYAGHAAARSNGGAA